MINRQFRLAARPVGLPARSDWQYTEEPAREPNDGEVLVRAHYLSLDPAMRGWMNDVRSYIAPVGLGEVMRAGGLGERGIDLDLGERFALAAPRAAHAAEDRPEVDAQAPHRLVERLDVDRAREAGRDGGERLRPAHGLARTRDLRGRMEDPARVVAGGVAAEHAHARRIPVAVDRDLGHALLAFAQHERLADLDAGRARASLARVGWPEERYAAASMGDAVKSGRTFVTEDAGALSACDEIECIIEATGHPIAGIRHAIQAIDARKHVVMVNVEADVLCGPLLAERARRQGGIDLAAAAVDDQQWRPRPRDGPGHGRELLLALEQLAAQLQQGRLHSSPAHSSKPHITLKFWIAWPAAPLTRLSRALATNNRP